MAVVWPILQEALTSALVGIGLGLALAVAAGRWIAGELYGVGPLDPATYAGVALVMTAVTVVACAVPTVRAMRVDPLVVLNRE